MLTMVVRVPHDVPGILADARYVIHRLGMFHFDPGPKQTKLSSHHSQLSISLRPVLS